MVIPAVRMAITILILHAKAILAQPNLADITCICSVRNVAAIRHLQHPMVRLAWGAMVGMIPILVAISLS